jgi:hypothetical protein
MKESRQTKEVEEQRRQKIIQGSKLRGLPQQWYSPVYQQTPHLDIQIYPIPTEIILATLFKNWLLTSLTLLV